MVTELTADQAYKVCGPENVGCDSSEELSALETIVGQDRAIRAMQFGLGIKEKGFNIYVSGMAGTGRTTAVRRFLEEVAVKKPVPMDWVYVNNFDDSYHPHALKLPAGRAVELQKRWTILRNSYSRKYAMFSRVKSMPSTKKKP